MRYIRFLKSPKIQDGHIKALVTITSDLGETFLPENCPLSASLRSDDNHGEIYLRKQMDWKSGMRSLPLSLNIEGKNIGWPARLHVSLRNGQPSDHFEEHHHGSNLPNIIGAWSDVLDPPNGKFEATKTVQRRFTSLSNRVLCIWEETGESIARHIWDAGLALSAYLDRMVARQTEGLPLLEELIPVASFRKLNIIELGSGCGIVGISLAQLIPDCSVLLTDLPEAREIAERNIAGMKPATDSRARYQELDWEQPLPKAIQAKTFDLIIVADCTYNPDSGPALVQTLEALVEKSPKSGVLLSMKVRHDSELVFFDLMKKANFVQKTQIQVTLPELGSDPEDVLVYIFHHKERQVYAENKTQLQNKSAVPFSPE